MVYLHFNRHLRPRKAAPRYQPVIVTGYDCAIAKVRTEQDTPQNQRRWRTALQVLARIRELELLPKIRTKPTEYALKYKRGR